MPKVFLSAGHGGSNPGAVAGGLKEKDINLAIMLSAKETLERHDVDVVCSRLKDEEDDVYEEVREANESGADIAAAFHVNAFKDLNRDGDGDANGSESFYYKGDPNGKRLAELCEKHVKALGQNSRGVKTDSLYFISQTDMTAVLCEAFFLDNSKDRAKGDTLAEQKAFGVAYAKAILEYFGIKYKEEVKNKGDKAPKGKKYKIQLGAYDYKSGAEADLKKIHKAGFANAFITLV